METWKKKTQFEFLKMEKCNVLDEKDTGQDHSSLDIVQEKISTFEDNEVENIQNKHRNKDWKIIRELLNCGMSEFW